MLDRFNAGNQVGQLTKMSQKQNTCATYNKFFIIFQPFFP